MRREGIDAMNERVLIVAVALIGALAACSKAPEKLAEKMIESSIEKDGTKAKVDLSTNSVKVTTTDASGKTVQMEMGAANVTEADVGIAFYPGTRPGEGEATRISGAEGATYSVILHSPDPVDKVAGFYRERMKDKSAGKQMTEMSSGDGGMMIVLVDEQAKTSTQVSVAKGEKGTDVQIVANRGVVK